MQKFLKHLFRASTIDNNSSWIFEVRISGSITPKSSLQALFDMLGNGLSWTDNSLNFLTNFGLILRNVNFTKKFE